MWLMSLEAGQQQPHGRYGGGAFSIFHHHSKGSEGSSGLVNKSIVRVYSKAESNFSLSVVDGKVILARFDPNDESQHWIKDEKFSTRVKDEEGFSSFALVNKVTGQAIKHSTGATHPPRQKLRRLVAEFRSLPEPVDRVKCLLD